MRYILHAEFAVNISGNIHIGFVDADSETSRNTSMHQ
jgi:hypothetical protein